MPAPETLLAPAVWVTAQNWARGLEDTFGDVVVCLPGRNLRGADALVERTGPTASVRSGRRVRLREARTLVKDVRLVRRRLEAAARYDLPTDVVPALVWQHHDLFLRAGAALAAHAGAPLLHFVDAPQVWEARAWGVRRRQWGWALERWGEAVQLRQADVVACVSQAVADASVALGADPERLLVTPCTADSDRFRPDVDARPLRRGLGLADDALVFGWSGSFRGFHGLDDVVAAFALVADRMPTARLLLVGDGAAAAAVRADVAHRGLVDRVVLTGAVPHAEMPEHVAAMDVALLAAPAGAPFHYSPLKVREYRAAGRPVVAAAAGQSADEFRDGVDALLYPPGDVRALADAMIRLAEDPGLAAEVARRGRQREVAENSPRAQVGRVLELLGRAVGAG